MSAAWFSSAHAGKAHPRPCHRFADPGGVGRVILLPAHIGFDIGRRHHPRVMAKLDQLARPMMGRTAGFHTDKTLGQLGEEGQHVLAAERRGDDHPPRSVNAMNLKNMLGQIEANGRDRRQIGDRLSHGRRSFRGCSTTTILAQLQSSRMPVRAPSTPSR